MSYVLPINKLIKKTLIRFNEMAILFHIYFVWFCFEWILIKIPFSYEFDLNNLSNDGLTTRCFEFSWRVSFQLPRVNRPYNMWKLLWFAPSISLDSLFRLGNKHDRFLWFTFKQKSSCKNGWNEQFQMTKTSFFGFLKYLLQLLATFWTWNPYLFQPLQSNRQAFWFDHHSSRHDIRQLYPSEGI